MSTLTHVSYCLTGSLYTQLSSFDCFSPNDWIPDRRFNCSWCSRFTDRFMFDKQKSELWFSKIISVKRGWILLSYYYLLLFNCALIITHLSKIIQLRKNVLLALTETTFCFVNYLRDWSETICSGPCKQDTRHYRRVIWFNY